MKPIILDATTKKLQMVMNGAAATTNPTYLVSYADVTTAFTEGNLSGSLNGTTPVDIVPAPAASTRRTVTEIVLYNADTAEITVTFNIDDNGTDRVIKSIPLAAGATWEMSTQTAIDGAPGQDASGGGGEAGRLTLDSTNLKFAPFKGDKININGTFETIPSAGVTLAPAGLSASTTYNIYAYMNGATMTLEASATTHATDATNGQEIKSGDATRSLVGMARTTGATAWADSATQRFILSYFNRKNVYGKNNFTATRTTTSSSYAEINTEIRIEFLIWADEAANVSMSGAGGSSATNGYNDTSFGIDGTTAVDAWIQMQSYTAGATVPYPLSYNFVAAEGYHYVTVLGKGNGNTGSWVGGATAGARTTMTLLIRG